VAGGIYPFIHPSKYSAISVIIMVHYSSQWSWSGGNIRLENQGHCAVEEPNGAHLLNLLIHFLLKEGRKTNSFSSLKTQYEAMYHGPRSEQNMDLKVG
jgi:hypothetical protein